MTLTCSEFDTSHRQSLSYSFVPIPAALKYDLLIGHLIAFDLVVVSEMIAIGAWRGRRDSCWTTKPVLADRLGVTTRTIQASWARLKVRGWLVEELVGPTDPDDPRNRTGRRYHFGWVGNRPNAARSDQAPKPDRPRHRSTEGTSGERPASPPGGNVLSPNSRRNLTPEKTTDGPVVVMAPPETPDREPGRDGVAPDRAPTPLSASPAPEALPIPLAEALDDPRVGEALRSQFAAAIPKWLATGHPVVRVAGAIAAMLVAARRGPVKNPVAYVVGTLTNMAAEGDGPGGLAPSLAPSRVPSGDETSRRVEAIRRGEELAAARQRRWEALPEAERAVIVAVDERQNPRPPGTHAKLWAIARHAACLEQMDSGCEPGSPS